MISSRGLKRCSVTICLFSTGNVDLGRTHLAYHQIHTGDSRPIKINPRKIPVYFEKDVVRPGFNIKYNIRTLFVEQKKFCGVSAGLLRFKSTEV